MTRLGISVASRVVRAVAVQRGVVVWAAAAEYGNESDLVDVVARLASEAPPARGAGVVLERDVVQTRTLSPAPLRQAALARRYVALESTRLFRVGAGGVVTDAAVVRGAAGPVLWTAAADTGFVCAIEEGCRQAGLHLTRLSVAAEVLPQVVASPPRDGDMAFPNTVRTEILSVRRGRVWRSRHVPGAHDQQPVWVPALAALGDRADGFAAAYAAAATSARLSLLAPGTRAARAGRRRRAAGLRAIAAGALLAVSLATWTARLLHAERAAVRELRALSPQLVAVAQHRRDLRQASDALAAVAAAQANRSDHLARLAALTTIAGDSLILVSAAFSGDTIVRIAGYAPLASRLLARLERLPRLRAAAFDVPPLRESVPGFAASREWDRFAATLRFAGRP